MAIWEDGAAVKGAAALHLTRKCGAGQKTVWLAGED